MAALQASEPSSHEVERDSRGYRLYDGKPSVLPPCDYCGVRKARVVRRGRFVCDEHRRWGPRRLRALRSKVRASSPTAAPAPSPFEDPRGLEDDQPAGVLRRVLARLLRRGPWVCPPTQVERHAVKPGRGRPRKVDPRE